MICVKNELPGTVQGNAVCTWAGFEQVGSPRGRPGSLLSPLPGRVTQRAQHRHQMGWPYKEGAAERGFLQMS